MQYMTCTTCISILHFTKLPARRISYVGLSSGAPEYHTGPFIISKLIEFFAATKNPINYTQTKQNSDQLFPCV